MVDMVHWWGRTYDPVLLARPVWWKVLIWIDALVFGPFYAVAIYAYARGKDWIRLPSILYGAIMLTDVTVILGEELYGPYRTPHPDMVLFANASWLLFPLLIICRMWYHEHPFTRESRAPDAATPPSGVAGGR
jgi:hypothetical protein